jgi:chromosome segregation ATPase
MKPDQIEKRLNWLDEQHRKDVDLVSLLETRLGDLIERIEKQEKQIKELSSEVTRLSAVASNIRQFDDALGKQRDDFSKKLADSEQVSTERIRHYEDIRKKDYEELSKSVSEFQIKLKEIDVLKDAMDARKQEEIRLSHEIVEVEEKVDSVTIKVEENTRGLHSIEEARRLDTKRITDLQSEATELRIKIDTNRGKQDSIEDRVRRAEAQINEIALSEANKREMSTLWEEKQELRLVEFEKNWKGWQVAFDDFQKKAIEVDEKILKYDENYRTLSKTKSELDKLVEKLERRITEISEMQRIGEERIKQEWTSFQADQQKQWNTIKLTNDELWRDHNRIHERITEEVQVMNEKISESLEALEDLFEKSESRVLDLLNLVRVWADEVEKRVSEIR